MILYSATAVFKNDHRSMISQSKGFTLIITISLLMLLIIIAVGLLGLSSLSLRNSTRVDAMQQAQANARLALMIALGELQSELGSDRRINCAAAMDAGSVPEHGQWLAVYDAWKAEDTQRPEANTRFRKYLVSGDRTALRNRDTAKSVLAGESIEILGQGTLGTAAQDGRVKVGLMSLTNSRGRYAWWISDENAKAKINAGLDVPTSVTAELLALQSMDSAPGTGFRMVEALNKVEVGGRQPWEMGDGQRSKSLSLASADLMPGALRPLSKHYHDLSTVSSGVLADVRSGRLKRDLSLYLEQTHTSRLQQSLYSVGSTATVNFSPDASSSSALTNTSGITMEELWLYYNLYKEVLYNRPATSDDRVGRRPSGFPTLLSGNSRDAVMSDRFYPYKRRVYSQVKYMLSLAAAPNPTQPGKFDLRIAVDPVVVLWNPYNVALEYQPGGYTTVGFTGLPCDAVFTTPSGTVSVPFTQFFDHQDVNRIQGLIGRDHAIVLQPGESRVFSRVEGQGDSLSSGWRYTEGTLLNQASFPKALNRDDIVRLTLRPAVNGGYLNYITFWFGPRTPNPALQSGTMIMRGDTTLGDLPTISTAQTITVGNVVDEKKIPHMLLSQYMRSETDNKTPCKPWLWSNPSVLYRMAADKSLTARLHHMIDIQVTPVSTWENPHVQITPGNQAYWGGGVRADFGAPFFTLRSVPLVPIKSIASFQHSCANGFRRYWKDSTVSVPASSFPSSANGLDGHRYLSPMGSKLIGNSFAHPLIPANKTHHDILVADAQANVPTAVPLPAADHAYLANAALWDSWYFSSLTPQTTHPFRSSSRTLQQVFDGFFPVSTSQKPVPLPSARMVPYRASSETTLRSLVKNNAATADAYRLLSTYLMVDGAFNVNSTSVTAWKALLGSLRDHAATRMDNASGGLTVRPAQSGSTPVTGLLVSNGGISTPTANTADATQWTGFRTMSDYEIEALATELVREIKVRGPFLCLSDFVNRRPGTNADLARHGALQAAIEAAGLNNDLDKGARALGSVAGAPFSEAGKGSRAAGIPGYISQADLLTPLGPVLQARSDTFTIRSYGCSTDEYGNLQAQAWCEAVVQRVPEYVDSKDAPDVVEASITSEANKKFGRKFRIVGFRWLKAQEI
jgi:type II secretory pathway pseudopilin PulG